MISACVIGIFASLATPISAVAKQDIVASALEYKAGKTLCEGWHAYDQAVTGKRPAVLIIHQWTGVSDNEKMRAHMLAGLGYNVLAADIYGKGIRPQPPESGKEAGKYKQDRTLYRERLLAALDTLKKDDHTDPSKVFVIGYCFGGTGALEVARSGAEVLGVVSFHGNLGTPTPQDAKNIKCPVLVCHGADDPYVPAAEVEAFKKEMDDAKVTYEFIAYPDAVHSFTQKNAGSDNSKGAAYNSRADAKSWVSMQRFFKDALENSK
ncbi:dienelactone hydrolase family protein [Phragmitibacter flavus]